MPSTPPFDSCFAVTEAHIREALQPAASLTDTSPRERVWALIDRMVAVAKPRQGAPKILLVLARMAGAEWIEGHLEVRVRPDGAGVVIEVLVDDGLSVTRLKPPMRVAAPYDELASAVELHAAMVEPLVPIALSDDGLVLRADQDAPEPDSGTMDVVASEVLQGDARKQRPIADRAPPSGRPSSKPGAKSARPGPKSVRPSPKSIRPVPKPSAKSERPAAKSVRPPPKAPFVPPLPGGVPRPAAKAPPIVPRAPNAPRIGEAERKPAPSDVTATVRKAVDPAAPRARAPITNVKATVKVDAIHIPREALREPKKPLPPPVRLTDSRKGGTPIPRDEEE